MYKLKKGILFKNKKKIFGLGESYYPSFHPSKFPVPPEGDRIGEMKKDLAMMAEIGSTFSRMQLNFHSSIESQSDQSLYSKDYFYYSY